MIIKTIPTIQMGENRDIFVNQDAVNYAYPSTFDGDSVVVFQVGTREFTFIGTIQQFKTALGV